MKEIFEQIAETISGAKQIAVLSHDRPDGDAIGSLVGLTLLIEQNLDCKALALNNDGVPQALKFLPECDRVILPRDFDANLLEQTDLIIALDAAGRDRISNRVWSALPKKTVINIDHHVSNTRYGDINLVVDTSPATGEIVYELAAASGWEIDRAIAENLFAAISTDTGSFRYPNTTSKTYRAAAAMIDAGVDVGLINQQLYESYPLRRVECIRDLLQELKLSCGGKCASVRLTREVKNRLQLGAGDTEGVVDIIRAIDSVIVAVFFEELDGNKIRVSSRSKLLSANVGKICERFGGGGHNLAAGTRMSGPIEDAEERFIAEVEKVL